MNYLTIIVNTIIIVVFLISLLVGHKKGFAETSINFVISIISTVLAFCFKNPLSVYMYTNLPFFNLDGVFKGVSVINVLIYELIAFMVLLFCFTIIFTVIVHLTNIDKLLFSLFVKLRIPNKLFGSIFCFLQTYIIMYFIIFVGMFIGNLFEFKGIDDTLAYKIYKTPILYETLEPIHNTISEIGSLVSTHESVNSKEEFNKESIKILLKYDIISEDNVRLLVEKDKLDIDNVDELFK